MDEQSAGRIGRIFGALERSLSWLDSLAKAVGVGILVALAALNFDAIANGVRGLAEKLPHLVKVSAFGVNVELDPAAMGEKFMSAGSPTKWLKENWKSQNTKNAVDGLNALDSRERARLMRINSTTLEVCRTEKPSADEFYDYASDKRLEETGLATLKLAPERLQQEREKLAKEAAPASGLPIDCYDIRLTAPGFDVHTMIIQSIAAAPTSSVGHSASSADAPAAASPSPVSTPARKPGATRAK